MASVLIASSLIHPLVTSIQIVWMCYVSEPGVWRERVYVIVCVCIYKLRTLAMMIIWSGPTRASDVIFVLVPSGNQTWPLKIPYK